VTTVLNGTVKLGDVVAYSSRKVWDLYVRMGVVIRVEDSRLLVRVTKSSDGRELTRLVWVSELHRVVKVRGDSG
jgi:hypothetical protein